MNEFNPEKIICPNCNGSKLRAIKDNHKILSYSCGNCGSDFDRDYERNLENGIVRFFIKRRDPDYVGPPPAPHTDIYEVGSKTIKE